VQLAELRRYAQAFGWQHDEVTEYDSGFKGEQPKLRGIVEAIRRKRYDVLLVYSLDRFSRQHPRKVNALLDQIVYDYGCRFISLREGIDSANEMVWHTIRPLFTYFANVYSRKLSEHIKDGIRRKRALGAYRGGRPRTPIDTDRLRRLAQDGLSLRRLAAVYNEGLPRRQRVSYGQVRRLLQKLEVPTRAQTGASNGV
jgi:DNA invertase Pin-like site-specific DNA recombinase